MIAVLSPEEYKVWAANKGIVAGVNDGKRVTVQCLQCEYKSMYPTMMRRHCGPDNKTHAKSAVNGASFYELMESGAWTFDSLADHAVRAPDEPPPPPKRSPPISVHFWLGVTRDIGDAAAVQRQHKTAQTSKGGVTAFLAALKTQGAALVDGPEGARRQKFKLAIGQHITAKKNEGGGAYCGQAIVDAWPHSAAFAAYQDELKRPCSKCFAGGECVCAPPVAGSSVPGFPALPTMGGDGVVVNHKLGVQKLQELIGNLRKRYGVRFPPSVALWQCRAAYYPGLSHPPGPPHCHPAAAAGSKKGEQRHRRRRREILRVCGEGGRPGAGATAGAENGR